MSMFENVGGEIEAHPYLFGGAVLAVVVFVWFYSSSSSSSSSTPAAGIYAYSPDDALVAADDSLASATNANNAAVSENATNAANAAAINQQNVTGAVDVANITSQADQALATINGSYALQGVQSNNATAITLAGMANAASPFLAATNALTANPTNGVGSSDATKGTQMSIASKWAEFNTLPGFLQNVTNMIRGDKGTVSYTQSATGATSISIKT